MKDMKKYYRGIVSLIIVLTIILLTVVAIIFKKERDERRQQALVSQSQALAEMITTVTIPEGYSVTQIAKKLEANEICLKNDFLEYVKNPPSSVLEMLNIEDTSKKIFALEGYIFPDTYEFYKNDNVENVVMKFVDNFKNKVTDEMYSTAKNKGYTMDEIVSIASIIQKEAGIKGENENVSSVIFNRLDKSMQIQCDVTINYLENYVKPDVDDFLDEYSDNYNTFKCSGIPAGAICNPGLDAINAALNPANTDYLFFVTDKNDTSKFYYSSTYQGHLSNCKMAGW